MGAEVYLRSECEQTSVAVAPAGAPYNCAHLFFHVFLRFLAKLLGKEMQTLWLICRATGELFLVDIKTTERVVGLEIGYLIETIASDGFFTNGDWCLFGVRPCLSRIGEGGKRTFAALASPSNRSQVSSRSVEGGSGIFASKKSRKKLIVFTTEHHCL